MTTPTNVRQLAAALLTGGRGSLADAVRADALARLAHFQPLADDGNPYAAGVVERTLETLALLDTPTTTPQTGD